MNPKRTIIFLSALFMGFGMLMLAPASEAMCMHCIDYEWVCTCQQRTTPTFTKVGANCAKAQQNAINAALAAASCNSGETSCGATSYYVSNCTLNHLGQDQASAFAKYWCESCSLECVEYETCEF